MFISYQPIRTINVQNNNFIKNKFNKEIILFLIVNLLIFSLIVKKNEVISYIFNLNLMKIKNNFSNKVYFKNPKNYTYFFYNNTKFINIDNKFYSFENNIDFSNYSSDIKVIAFYSPKFYTISERDNLFGQNLSDWDYVNKAKSLLAGHYQPRKPGDEINYLGYYDNSDIQIITKQIKLAKSHGIYGFGIYYYWFSGKIIYEKPLDIYIKNKNIDFPFFLIWKNINCKNLINNINKNIKEEKICKSDNPEQFIYDIKKYILDTRYIRINGKPVIGIYEPLNINNLNLTLRIWREKAKEFSIGDIYILINLNNYDVNNLENTKLFDAAYEFPPKNGLYKFKVQNTISHIYTGLIYNSLNFTNNRKNFPIFRGSMLEYDDSSKNGKNGLIFDEYSPEKFYFINKEIIKWTKSHYNLSNRFIFINAWNEWSEGCYLEPDEKYGYSSINALSKALFNITFNNYNLFNLNSSSYIAVQAHVYYENLINEIIEKTNNIPVKFDLLITTTSLNKYKIIGEYIKKNSNSKNYEIKIVENKGRDILPLLNQLKNMVKKYKYICHIHSKKTENHPYLGKNWRYYLYNNLLGSKEIVSEILSDFENYDRLGFIFPETYFQILLYFGKKRKKMNEMYLNYLLKTMFPNNEYQTGNQLDFPAGNMFWARVLSIYQIFELNILDKFPKEKGQIDCTIMHGIERIWLYLVKLNGYYYKKIFKYY